MPAFWLHLTQPSIAAGVNFDTIAREWRFKWSADADKASLVAAQKQLAAVLKTVKAVQGVNSVQRVVCGGCQDFKVIVSLKIADFKAWEAKGFAPEKDFLAAVEKIPGVSKVETQTFTLMTL